MQKASAHWTLTSLGILHWMCAGAFVMCVLDLHKSGVRTGVLLLGFSMVGTLWLLWWAQARRMRAAQRSQTGPFPIRFHLVADNHALTLESALGSSTVPWIAFDGLQANRDRLFLYFKNGACVSIPNTAFVDPQARTSFIEAVNAYLGGAVSA